MPEKNSAPAKKENSYNVIYKKILIMLSTCFITEKKILDFSIERISTESIDDFPNIYFSDPPSSRYFAHSSTFFSFIGFVFQ